MLLEEPFRTEIATGSSFYMNGHEAVLSHLFDDGPVCICFDPWYPTISESMLPFAFRYLKVKKKNVIAVKSLANDWYQNDGIGDILDHIDHLAGARRRIGYGASMGGYAAINYSRRLRIDHVIASSPQYSIDPAKAPFEKRYLKEAVGLKFETDDMESCNRVGGIIIYDPFDKVDKFHIAKIRPLVDATIVKVPFAGYSSLDYFGISGILDGVISRVLAFEISGSDVVAARRSVRRSNLNYWSGLSDAFLERRRYASALDAARRAVTFNGDKVLARIRLGSVLFAAGELEESEAVWSELVSDEAVAPRALWYAGSIERTLKVEKLYLFVDAVKKKLAVPA